MSLDDFEHPSFLFVLVPEDINEAPREIRFEGKERSFRDYLLAHFSNEKINSLNAEHFDEFKKGLKDKVQGKLSDEGVDRIVSDSAHNYQVRKAKKLPALPRRGAPSGVFPFGR